MADDKRRPIADFFIFARESPNAALGWTFVAIALLGLVGFGIFRAVGGSDDSKASGSDKSAQVDDGDGGSGNGSDGSSDAGGSAGTSSNTTAKGNGSGTTPSGGSGSGGGLGTDGSGGLVTVPTLPDVTTVPPKPLPRNLQKWIASPSDVHMKAGKMTRGYVVVLNQSDERATVESPGCSSGPAAAPATSPQSGPGDKCRAGRIFVVQPHKTQKFVYTWHATQTGRAGAPPLPPGSYFFNVGPVNVHVTVK